MAKFTVGDPAWLEVPEAPQGIVSKVEDELVTIIWVNQYGDPHIVQVHEDCLTEGVIIEE